jgi:hypothetical protein
VLKKLKDNDLLWEKMVPLSVADAIKRRGLFGHVDNALSPSGVQREITDIVQRHLSG